MRVCKLDEFLRHDKIDDEEEREQLHARFPHVAVVECDFPELDVAVRWCWLEFGPMHGECWGYSEYPVCSLILETEYRKLVEFDGAQWEIKSYRQVVPHCHKGEWGVYWLGKTEYDHGFGEFCFADKSRRYAFVQRVPSFDWGENYPWLRA